MRTITLEEHYASPAFMEGPGSALKEQAQAARAHPLVAAGFAELVERLGDLDERRIADMDGAGIDVQVLSLTAPGVEQLEAAEAVCAGEGIESGAVLDLLGGLVEKSLVILSSLVRALAVKFTSQFSRAVVALTLLPAYACAMLLVMVSMLVYQTAQSGRERRDAMTAITSNGTTRYEAAMANELMAEIRGVLEL